MDVIAETTKCDDGSCCCLPIKYSVVMISVLSIVLCLVDTVVLNSNKSCCSMKEYVEGAKQLLQWLFQIANFLLVGSVVLESVPLVNVYLWFTLNYVMLGLCVAILELLCQFVHEGVNSVTVFCCEVVFFFVVLVLCVAMAILDLLCQFVHEGVNSVAVFCSEVVFIFVLSRCLPIVNSYKKELAITTSSSYY